MKWIPEGDKGILISLNVKDGAEGGTISFDFEAALMSFDSQTRTIRLEKEYTLSLNIDKKQMLELKKLIQGIDPKKTIQYLWDNTRIGFSPTYSPVSGKELRPILFTHASEPLYYLIRNFMPPEFMSGRETLDELSKRVDLLDFSREGWTHRMKSLKPPTLVKEVSASHGRDPLATNL